MVYSHDIIIEPLLTEKTYGMMQDKRYTFRVAKNANKYQIKDAVEKIFGVQVAQVNTVNMKGKTKRMGANVGRRPNWKKAIVTLTSDSKAIEFFEGM